MAHFQDKNSGWKFGEKIVKLSIISIFAFESKVE